MTRTAWKQLSEAERDAIRQQSAEQSRQQQWWTPMTPEQRADEARRDAWWRGFLWGWFWGSWK